MRAEIGRVEGEVSGLWVGILIKISSDQMSYSLKVASYSILCHYASTYHTYLFLTVELLDRATGVPSTPPPPTSGFGIQMSSIPKSRIALKRHFGAIQFLRLPFPKLRDSWVCNRFPVQDSRLLCLRFVIGNSPSGGRIQWPHTTNPG